MKTIHVQDGTYFAFTDELAKMVVAKKGKFVTQDEALALLILEVRELRKKAVTGN